MYEKGLVVEKSNEEAIKWYKEAASLGHGSAQYNLGVIYYRGTGVEKDLRQAVYWWMIASKTGMLDAWHTLGLMYANGVERHISDPVLMS